MRDALSASLGIRFDTRESGFKGGEYYLARVGGSGKVTIEANWVDDEGYLAEPDFPNHSTLVYATDLDARMLSALENAAGLPCLRVEHVD
ncbi:hypothetical protein [Streptomyces sp. B3I8]|uniref:hypothetical protein n=1 Tax=Streptomyces sp. B3I8 TaxID=3042303 RepID=UPI0027D8C0C2|nr:hypothetical protein [Streptomyces sp. B3I8]